jgi:hypothetical protein
MTAPAPWDALRSRVAALIAVRESVLDETATGWARFARGQCWSRADVEAFWDGLTEDVARRYARAASPSGRPAADTRDEVLATMAALRTRVLDRLGSGR